MYKLADISLFESYQQSTTLNSLAVFNAPDIEEYLDDNQQEPEEPLLESKPSKYPQFDQDPRMRNIDVGDIGKYIDAKQTKQYSAMEATIDANVMAIATNLADLRVVLRKLYLADEGVGIRAKQKAVNRASTALLDALYREKEGKAKENAIKKATEELDRLKARPAFGYLDRPNTNWYHRINEYLAKVLDSMETLLNTSATKNRFQQAINKTRSVFDE